jgi:hypothetical protein
MARLNNYHQYFLLDERHVVELNDNEDILWVKETKVLDVPLKGGKRTTSNWCKHAIDDAYDLPDSVSEIYSELVQAECECAMPVAEYEVKCKQWGGFYSHRLQKYSNHFVYHAHGSDNRAERVVIAKDADTLINHSKGIGGLYYGLIASQAAQ